MRSKKQTVRMKLERPGKCHFRPSGRFVVEKFSLYATRQPMVALWLDVAPQTKNPAYGLAHEHGRAYSSGSRMINLWNVELNIRQAGCLTSQDKAAYPAFRQPDTI